MHIAFAANRRSVAKELCRCANGCLEIRFCLLLAFKFRLCIESDSYQHSSSPRSKIFRGEIFARDFAQIIVHILRCYVPHLATIGDILEQMLTRQILAFRNNFCDSPVGHVHLVLAAALPSKTKTQLRTLHPHMAILYRG